MALPRTTLTVDQLQEKVNSGYSISVSQWLEIEGKYAGCITYDVNTRQYIEALHHVRPGVPATGVTGIDYEESKNFYVTEVLVPNPYAKPAAEAADNLTQQNPK